MSYDKFESSQVKRVDWLEEPDRRASCMQQLHRLCVDVVALGSGLGPEWSDASLMSGWKEKRKEKSRN